MNGLVGKPYAKEGIADLSYMAIEKDEELSLIELYYRYGSAERAGEGCSGRQGDGEGQENVGGEVESDVGCTKSHCDRGPVRRTGEGAPLTAEMLSLLEYW